MLGHLSMLLDVVLSPDAKFILTADRGMKTFTESSKLPYHLHLRFEEITIFIRQYVLVPKGVQKLLVLKRH